MPCMCVIFYAVGQPLACRRIEAVQELHVDCLSLSAAGGRFMWQALLLLQMQHEGSVNFEVIGQARSQEACSSLHIVVCADRAACAKGQDAFFVGVLSFAPPPHVAACWSSSFCMYHLQLRGCVCTLIIH